MSSAPSPFNTDTFPLTFIDPLSSRNSKNWRSRMKDFPTSYLNGSARSNSLTLTPDDTSNNYYQLIMSDSRVANSNCAQLFIELMDAAYDEFQLEPYKNRDTYNMHEYYNPANSLVINTSPRTKCRKRNVIEVVIRSRLINNFNVFIKDPRVPEVHRLVQRKLSIASSFGRDQNLSAPIHNYLDVLREVLSSSKHTPRNVILFMNVLVEKALSIDKTFNAPIAVVNRVQNCKIYYLNFFYTNYIILVNNNVMQFLDTNRNLISCKVCLKENIVGVLLKPCNHSSVCKNCLQSLIDFLCPICHIPVVSSTIFLS